ncbi:MAG TPA: dimethyladenosine transferase, partial [Marmoricola sp.]|nr:dimethyladenosine transferase [Marmoricola sp.]
FLTGRIWRYELEPVEGGTRVTESWDIREEALPSRALVRSRMSKMTRRNMERTLARIEEIVTA